MPRPSAPAVANRNGVGIAIGSNFKMANPSSIAQPTQSTANPPSTRRTEKNETHPSPACSAPIRMNTSEKMKIHEARDMLVVQRWENDRLVGPALPLRRNRRNAIVGAGEPIQLAGIQQDVMIPAKLVEVAPQPGIDDIFPRRDNHIEDGAIFESRHGKRS